MYGSIVYGPDREIALPGTFVWQRDRECETSAISRFHKTCLATLKPDVPEGPNWIYEIKYDGYRVQAHLKRGSRLSTPAQAMIGPSSLNPSLSRWRSSRLNT